MVRDYNTVTDAVIYFKNGKRKYGVLIENKEADNSFQFIPNGKFVNPVNFNDSIELVSAELIEAIDINLK